MAISERILIVDDDADIRRLLADYLQRAGYRTVLAADGEAMWRQLEDHDVALLVLDLMLPGADGLALCRQLRARSGVPVIMLSARGELVDRIVGLEVGADDYLPKPFDPRELLARIRGVLRRSGAEGPARGAEASYLCFDEWRLDTAARQLRSPQGMVIALGGSDYRVLRALLERANRAVSRSFLSDHVYRKDYEPSDRAIDVCISRLRRHLEKNAMRPQLIRTVRHVGYMLAAEVSAEA